MLPPSLAGVACGDFLRPLLATLLQRGVLLDELGPGEARAHHSALRASWMGLCRCRAPPGLPGPPPAAPGPARRIDFKVFAPASAPFAVNYFASSQAVCRATRLRARQGAPEAARRAHPAATGFKLSDAELVPVARRAGQASRGGGGGGKRRREGGEDDRAQAVAPPVPCACETDLFFEALGLALPVHMRTFDDYV